MDTIFSLAASVSGLTVTLTWTLTNVAGVTSVQLQRAPFGSANWANVGASIAPATLTTTDTTPEPGDFAYRLAISTNAGGVSGANTTVYSNEVNITTLATLGAVVLTGSATTSAQGLTRGYTQVNLSWVIGAGDINTDAITVVIQRSLNGGVTFVTAVSQLDEFENYSFSEQLPTGSGSIQYRLIASLPNSGGQLNTPISSTSNVVTLSI